MNFYRIGSTTTKTPVEDLASHLQGEQADSVTQYSAVTSGTSCEEAGSAKITTLEECRSAFEEVGLDDRVKGTENISDQPAGCYLRSDGDVWFNEYGQTPALCTSQSKCDVCEIGKELVITYIVLRN